MSSTRIFAALLGLAFLAPATGLAQDEPDPPAVVENDDEFVIVGEILKPEITVVISRENLNKAYDLKLDETFLEKIIESVEKEPF